VRELKGDCDGSYEAKIKKMKKSSMVAHRRAASQRSYKAVQALFKRRSEPVKQHLRVELKMH
jgi:hypothetical protein